MDQEYLFLSCNARDASRRKGPPRAYIARRHVQLHRGKHHENGRATALPLQIRFNAVPKKCQCCLLKSVCVCPKGEREARRPRLAKTSCPVPAVVSFSASGTELRASHLAHYLSVLCLEDNPVSFVSSRLIYNNVPLLDHAADAFIHLLDSPRTPQGVVVPTKAAAGGYFQALVMLRSCFSVRNLSTHDCLSIIGLLGLFDVLVRDRYRATVDCFTHWRGVSAVILQDPLESSRSRYARATVGSTAGGCLTSIIPCFQGRASVSTVPRGGPKCLHWMTWSPER
ncbi:hypothetical protein M409DRAFT_55480 [Zasmidium cellare ATCC 36951]|uniref:Uncharacterized protein n=1 Tax=Zasmidium cellare ATCC 36951 TaxID=1080233 RepID=A0A6A6CEC5_ZASCE|nr:uncharacterized protein M409DRAFT_55480 [Zasmidium cellare ATCC 36951]KAF2165577.1 hypothetical protein M409DRAFT_55480 [Zasmidium cellare ATCC 36951]